MKTVFLTGHNGFIGKHLFLKLIDLGYEVYLPKENEVPLKNYDYIIHLAAKTTTSADFIPDLYESNIVYARNIMSRPGRIIYASSTSASELINPYSYTKQYIEWLGKRQGNATGLRFFNVYGNGNNKGIIKKAIECSKTGETLNLTGGDQIRDFIYIDDVISVIIKSLDGDIGIFDVGTGKGTSINEAINCVQRVTGSTINVNHINSQNTDMKISVSNTPMEIYTKLEDGLRFMLCEY